MKERIDIELLLQEAYGRYRVERVTPAKVLGVARPLPALRCAGAAFMELGTRIDTSGQAAGMLAGFAEAGAVPADIADLHDRVLALPDVFLDNRPGQGVEMWTHETAEDAGGQIARADGGAWVLSLPDRRARVHQVVTTALVVAHAKLGTRPDPCEEGARAVPFDTDKRGRAVVWDHDGRRDAICPVRFDPHPDSVARMRGEYAVWWGALAGLVACFGREPLARFEVSGPKAARAPWAESAAVVHMDLRGSVLASQRNA
ncbi:hypothetical protein [Terrihabitans sp. B22-R8]|uniref:hypothetical protein n=1 Tax=Terrihabitans sp. B22-R8 TaxID=3425128 RepID=UPI00403D3B87